MINADKKETFIFIFTFLTFKFLKKIHIILTLIILSFAQEGYSQLSKTHYIPPVTGDGGGNGQEYSVFISQHQVQGL